MKFLKITIVLAIAILLVGCLKKEEPPKPVVDYGGITDYYVVNNSGMNLSVTYKIAPSPVVSDSTVILPSNAKTQIFRYGGLGGLFPPSYVFDHLIFYNESDNDKNNRLLTIEPVADDKWKDAYKEGDSVRSYELIITAEDLK
jgi:hypothetical protein